MAEQHEKALVPQIRFTGFTDPWEQRKLGELCSFSKGCGYSKNDLRDQGTPIILYGRLYTNYETQIHSVDTFVKPLENSVYSEGGEVIIPASGETAEDISIASVVEKPGIILGGDLNVITSSADIDPVFLALELSYGKPHFDLAKRAQGKSVVHIHNEDIANVFFGHPNIAEQRRIGAFFDRLDSLITLHQRKYDKLCVLKKSMLDKMFPKGGSLYPEIRFAGFTDPWEQCKFSELVDRVTVASNDPLLPQVEYEDINSGEGTLNKDLGKKDGGKTGILFEPGDILYGKLRPYLMNWLHPQFRGIAIGDFWVLRPSGAEGTCLYRLIQSDSFQRLADISSGSKMPRADWSLISSGEFLIPSDDAEQRRIGAFLDRLDSLITLHQRKLELLRNIKKSMLDKMFV